MNTEILKIKGDWLEVVDDCRATVGKESLGKEPSAEFKRKVLLAEHSPIRSLSVKWRWRGIASWIATHWSRHKWECFIKTQRTDRTGTDRNKLPQDAPVDFTGEANAQHLIDTMRKRLCFQAAAETRRYAEDLKHRLASHEAELSAVLVPNCVYRGGCPEIKPCRLWERLVEESGGEILTDDIQRRYDIYNELRG